MKKGTEGREGIEESRGKDEGMKEKEKKETKGEKLEKDE